jgi:hypothetical protein
MKRTVPPLQLRDNDGWLRTHTLTQRADNFFQTKAGRAVAGGFVVLALLVVFLAVRSYFAPAGASAANERLFICAKTGKTFEYTLKFGDPIPVKSPHSGEDTGYPADLCYWTREGAIKKDPTPVLVKSRMGDRAPTFCPDCGRLVVVHNPKPNEGDKPPPTEAEYKPSRGGTRTP